MKGLLTRRGRQMDEIPVACQELAAVILSEVKSSIILRMKPLQRAVVAHIEKHLSAEDDKIGVEPMTKLSLEVLIRFAKVADPAQAGELLDLIIVIVDQLIPCADLKIGWVLGCVIHGLIANSFVGGGSDLVRLSESLCQRD